MRCFPAIFGVLQAIPWFLLAAVSNVASAEVPSPCVGIVPEHEQAGNINRSPTEVDIARLRDIGYPDASIVGADIESPLSVSPDGTHVAFVLFRGDPATNAYCVALVSVALNGMAQPKVLDMGGELIRLPDSPLRGVLTPSGFPALVRPKWTSDGHAIAYLRRDKGVTQVWLVDADGTHSRSVTTSPVDIEAFSWMGDTNSLIYRSQTGLVAERSNREQASLTGYLYDDRFVPGGAGRPRLWPSPMADQVVDSKSGIVSTPHNGESKWLDSDMPESPDPHSSTTLFAQTSDGYNKAWIVENREPGQHLKRLWIKVRGKISICSVEACEGNTIQMWWSPDGRLIFLKREGWRNGVSALYQRSSEGKVRRLLATEDVLIGCQLAEARLLCLKEGSTQPRRLVSISLNSGSERVLFDPNPEFKNFNLGNVRRLYWKNDIGKEAWGDLVLPPSHRPGVKLPLIVVQYHSDGFLRGGTGDEYPIYAFAARGYAVLSFENPLPIIRSGPGTSPDQAETINLQGWQQRKSLASALMIGIQRVIDMGIADPARIGLTGFSDGVTTGQYVLINDNRFAAAAFSHCCMELRSTMVHGGSALADQLSKFGYPRMAEDGTAFWQPMSLVMNANKISTPILMQLPDEEYLIGLEAFTALKEHNQPVELYVFPDEYHVKWQPAHKLAVYQRNLDWFDYWLLEKRDPAPVKQAQYERWDRLKSRRPLAP